MSKSIRIATWNIAGGHTMRSLDRFDYSEHEEPDYFANELRKLGAHVVCLQESHANEHDSLSERIGRMAGYEYVLDTDGSQSHINPQYSLISAILSKVPFKNKRNHRIPLIPFEGEYRGRKLDKHIRDLQIVQLDDFFIANIHTNQLRIYDLTYDANPGLAYGRAVAADMAAQLACPLLFAGDFNIDRLDKVYPQVLERHTLQEVPFSSATSPRDGSPDHILFSPEFRCTDAGIVETKSDHYLCWADFEK